MTATLTFCVLFTMVMPSEGGQQAVIVVRGAAGTEKYAPGFEEAVELWQEVAQQGQAAVIVIDGDAEEEISAKEHLQDALQHQREGVAPLWLVFVGHGTFDGQTARFNLEGPDVSAEEVAEWLAEVSRPVIVVNGTSASAPFLPILAGPNRIIVTATKSGHERSYARFGEYFAEAVADPQADLDQDGQTSLLEAFLATSQRVAEFYEQAGRLATEHALLEDNGDGVGTPASAFHGPYDIRVESTSHAPDGRRAHQMTLVPSALERQLSEEMQARRNAIELRIFALRDHKAELAEEEYFAELENLLLEMAQIYREIREAVSTPSSGKESDSSSEESAATVGKTEDDPVHNSSL